MCPKAEGAPFGKTQREAAALSALFDRHKFGPPPTVKACAKAGKVEPDHADQLVWQALVEQAFGMSGAGAMMLLSQAIDTADPDRGGNMALLANEAIGAVASIEPRDAIEGMLAVQMVAVHRASMVCMRRAGLAEQSFEGRQMNLAHGAKLSRSFAALVEALNRHRGKGQQKVVVEHVHVYPGGQANVGLVGGEQPAAIPGRGGGSTEIEGQSHGQAALPLPGRAPVLCHVETDPAAVRGAGGEGQERLPVPRRPGRCAKG